MVSKNFKKELKNQLENEWIDKSPYLDVYLKRLVKKNYDKPVSCAVVYFKNEIYIYDMYLNKYLPMKDYGKTWALTKGELKNETIYSQNQT